MTEVPDLQSLPQWVLWRIEEREDGDGKPTKVPYTPASGRKADSTAPKTWSTYQRVADVLAKRPRDYSGAGFVFTAAAGIVGIDLDHCLDDGFLAEWAEGILEPFRGQTYVEVSPSGTGLHIYCRAKMPGKGISVKYGGPGGKVEVYGEARYFTFTGDAYGDTPLAVTDCQESVDQLYALLTAGRAKHVPTPPAATSGNPEHDSTLLDIALRDLTFRNLWSGPVSDDHSADDLALCNKLAFYFGGDAAAIDRMFRQSGQMRPKWNREDYRSWTIGKAIAGTTTHYTPNGHAKPFASYLSDSDRESGAEADGPASKPDWREDLIVSTRYKDGVAIRTPKPILANAVLALRSAPEWAGVLRFDSFASRIVVGNSPPWKSAPKRDAQWTDQETRLTAIWLQQHQILCNVDTVGQAVQTVAFENAFNPVRDYLNGLTWDGTRRIDGLAELYLAAQTQDRKYLAAVSSKFMIASAARALSEVPVKVDCVPVLESKQGGLKSTAAQALFSPWFADHLPPLDSKDSFLQLMGTWGIELSELDTISRSTATKVKGFLSAASDKLRMPYGRICIEVPRHNVFIATTNADEWHVDETGGRRFWPIRCGDRIRIEELRRDRDQLWSEAVIRYRAGETWWMDTPELNRLAEVEMDARYCPGPWDSMISRWLDHPKVGHLGGDLDSDSESTTVSDILLHCVGKPMAQWGQSDKNSVARFLVHEGWKRQQDREGKARIWRYYRGAR